MGIVPSADTNNTHWAEEDNYIDTHGV